MYATCNKKIFYFILLYFILSENKLTGHSIPLQKAPYRHTGSSHWSSSCLQSHTPVPCAHKCLKTAEKYSDLTYAVCMCLYVCIKSLKKFVFAIHHHLIYTDLSWEEAAVHIDTFLDRHTLYLWCWRSIHHCYTKKNMAHWFSGTRVKPRGLLLHLPFLEKSIALSKMQD